MQIKRVGTQPSGKGPEDWFTGTVRIDPLFTTEAPARGAGASVTFEPGARTAWHTHPLGLFLTRRTPLARCDSYHRYDPYSHTGKRRRKSRRLDGKSDRRPIPYFIR